MFPLLIYVCVYKLLYFLFILVVAKIYWCLLFLSGRTSWFWRVEGNIYRSIHQKIAIHIYVFAFKCFLSLTSFIVIFIFGKLPILGTQLNILMVLSFVHENKVYDDTKLLQVWGSGAHQWPWTALSRPAWPQVCLVTGDISGGPWLSDNPQSLSLLRWHRWGTTVRFPWRGGHCSCLPCPCPCPDTNTFVKPLCTGLLLSVVFRSSDLFSLSKTPHGSKRQECTESMWRNASRRNCSDATDLEHGRIFTAVAMY